MRSQVSPGRTRAGNGGKRLLLPRGLSSLLRALAAEAEKRGLEAYAVGGCVRDWALGRPTKDLDVVLESDPQPLARFCADRLGAKLETFDRFGTIRVVGAGLRLDFVRARAETYPEPTALPVVRPGSLRDDLLRRDFSINAMAARLRRVSLGEIVDPLGGLRDLERRRVRVLHEASFRDDPTRIHRAARFACRFDFSLDSETERLRREAMRAEWPSRLSRERLRGELWRILEERDPRCALARCRSWGLAALWHPRFAWSDDVHKGESPLERLILIALRMGPARGAELIRSLNLERAQSQAALGALETARGRAAPRGELPPAAAAALRRALKPSSSALRPLVVNGGDLAALGLRPGPVFSRWLDRAARAQWKGEFSTREAGLRWLRARLP